MPLMMLSSRLCRSRALCSLTEICKRSMLQKFNVGDLNQSRSFSRGSNKGGQDSVHIPGAVSSKFKVFKNEESPIILDIEEERRKYQELNKDSEKSLIADDFSGMNLERGLQGVFDIEELVEVLRTENMKDIFVATLPQEIKYVDYIVVVTGKSPRHMNATAEFVRKLYKKKRNSNDIIPKIEGENSKDWIALDLGNIALHIFSSTAREVYDLESLWTVGAAYDQLCNKDEDPLVKLLMQHSIYLGDLEPADSNR